MSDFTYETADIKTPLETYEWDNTWIEQANDHSTPRVLYIGNSISCGTRRLCTSVSNKTLLFDGFGTSKSIDNPYFFKSIQLFAEQEGRRDAIIFNSGLHGWHIEDKDEYRFYYEKMIRFLLENFKDVPLFLALSTTVKNEERERRVLIRNSVVKALAEEYNLSVIDLYSVSLENIELRSEDGVHFEKEGYRKLAERIVADIKEKIYK